MADIQANIGIGVDTTQALAAIRQLQREISVFHTLMAKGGASAAAKSMQLQQGLINTINETGKFSAGMTRISSSTESFTNALEKNKLSMTQYFRYAGGASKSFGKTFTREFNTINQVATERVKDLQTQYISMGRDANGALQAIKVRPLALDMDNLGTKVQLAAQKQQIFNQLMKQGTTNLLNFGKNTQWAGRQLMVGFTIPLTIFGATAAREFQKLEEQAVKFRRVYGDMFSTDADTEKALSNVRALAEEFTKYGIAVEKTIGLAAKVAQMGNVGEDLTAQVTQATRLAVLGGIEQEEALDTTISLTNAFGIAAEDLAGKIAFLNAAENQTILSIEDFNIAIPKAGSVVRQLGGDVEDLAFFLTAMREGGINASESANALKSGLASIINPTRQSIDKMKEFGIDVVGIVDKNAGNLKQTVMALASELNSLDPLDRARAIEQLFGKFQFARISTLFQNITKEGTQARKILDLTANSTEELAIIAERELGKVEQSPAFKLQKQMEQLKAALAPIGEEFIKAVGPLIEFGTKLLKSFNNLGEGGKQFVVILTAVAGVIAPAALMAFGLIANGIANLLKFFLFLGNAFGRISGQSTMLGGQTEYMTQQQIEAAAVAASLGQSHSNLTQIFTAEASAVAALVTQYRAAIIEQRKFGLGQAAASAAARSPRGVAPRSFAKGGIIRGPGTGTSDSIPAMVSNGEAIIPAKQTQRYHGLIEAIIANQVPGYATAKLPEPSGAAIDIASRIASSSNKTDSIAKQIEKEMQKRARHFGLTMEQSAEDLKKALSSLAQASIKSAAELQGSSEFSGIRGQRVSEVEGQTQFAHFGGGTTVTAKTGAEMSPNRALLQTVAKVDPEHSLSAKHSWGMDLSRQANREMDVSPDQIAVSAARGETPGRKGGLIVEEMAARSEEEAFQSLKQGLELGGADVNDQEVQATAVEYHKKIVSLLDKKLKENADAMVVDTDEQLAMMTPNQQKNAISMESIERSAASEFTGTKFGAARKAALDRPKELRLRVNESLIEKAQGALGRGDITQKEYDSLSDIKKRGGSKDIQLSRTAELPGMDDLKKDSAEVGRNIVRSQIDASEDEAGIGSPAKRFIEIGRNIVNSTAMGMKEEIAEQKGKPPLPGNLAAPKPPVGPTPTGKSGIGQRLIAGFEDSRIGKGIGKQLAKASGNAITDSKGQVYYDPNEDMSTEFGRMTAKQRAFNDNLPGGKNYVPDLGGTVAGGVIPVRVVNQVEFDPALQNALDSGTIESENLADTMSRQESSVEDLARSQREQTKENRASRKEEKRQNRQSRAGKALGVLGTATMVAGMATQVEGEVGKYAQQLVGPLAALSGIAPVLLALGPLWGTVAAGLGLLAYSVYQNYQMQKKMREESKALADSFSSGRDAVNKFAEFAGTATAAQIQERKRQAQGEVFQIEPGKTTFGQSFVASEEGEEFVSQIELGIARLGRSDAIQRFSNQLSSAVISGALDLSQAKSIASSIGAAMEDRSFGISVTGELVKLFGPDGENLLENPLALTTAFQQNLEEMAARTTADLVAPEITREDVSARAVQLASNFELNSIDFLENIFAGFDEEKVIANRVNSSKFQKLARESLEMQGQEVARQDLIDLIQFNSDALDSITTQYEKAYKEAQDAGDISKMVELREQYVETRQNFSDASMQAFNDLTSQFNISDLVTQDEMLKSSKDSILAVIGDEKVKEQTDVGLGRLGSRTGVTREIEFKINTLLESGQISPETFNKLIAEPTTDFSMVADIGAKYGPNAQQILNQISSLEDDDIRATVTAQFAAEDTTVAGGLSLFDMLNNAADIGLLFPDKAGVLVSFFAENQDIGAMVDENVKEIQDVVDSGEPITLDVIQRVYAENPEVVAAVKADQEAFEAMSPQDQVEFLQSVDIIYNVKATGEPWLLQLLRDEAGIGPGGVLTPEKEQETIVNLGQRFTRIKTPDLTGSEPPEPKPTGSGSGPQLDSLLKKLRDVRDASISLKKGWEGMQEVLSSVFAGDKQMTVFDGLEKQLRNFNLGENLIAMIIGMDPDEFEKRKKELFNIDGTPTEALRNMNKAFNAVAIGEYVNSQEKFIQKTKNQTSAIAILTANGMSLADAYEAVQDEALAAAIAMGATREEIAEILRVTKLAKEQEAELEKQRERSRISESVRKTNEEFRNQVAILKELSKAQGRYSDEQIKALMSDTDLQKLFLDPTIDKGALEEALRNAEQQANLEVQINLLTKTGQETEFDKYLTEINDYFTKEENLINVNFDLATADDNKLIEDAQNQISDIQYKLDDYNAELEQISWLEDDINEKYDKRSEALDEIANANEKIANQQKAQLDIADALSKGDISAAARAIQELRSQEAQQAQETQKDQLDRAREAELKSIIGPGGRNREQLEEEIKQLERQLFFIEEQTLEPAQERNRIAAVARDLAIDQLKLNEMTRMEFDQISAATKQSAINMEDMVTSARKLIALGEFIQTGEKGADWEELFPQPKATPAPAPSGGGGGSSAPVGKANWQITSGEFAGMSLQKAAESKNFGTWQEFYNTRRDLDKVLTPASGGLIGKYAMGGMAKKSRSGPPLQMAMGGKVGRYAAGGMIVPKRMAMGGYSMGSDIIPAMLTPGEFVVRRPAVSAFGVDKLEKINRGTYNDGSVYNYNLAVNVKSDSDPNRIARAVITNIKSIENQRIRGNKL